MSTLLTGDVHLDKKFPYTNRITEKRWDDLRTKTLDHIFSFAASERIQLGDLYDKYSVSGYDLFNGYLLATRFSALLAGNHDKSNNTEKASSIALLSLLPGTKIAFDSPKKVNNYLLVPHQITQEVFEGVLKRIIEAGSSGSALTLLLHCNYGEPKGSDTENYLRPAIANELLKVFRNIVVGHEHNYRVPQVGVTMAGAILPMNFGEMTDKYVWLDRYDGKLDPLRVWEAQGNYMKSEYSDFMSLPLDTPLQFIEVLGELDTRQTLDLNYRLADWYLKSNSIIAIKNSTTRYKQNDYVQGSEECHTLIDWVSLAKGKMTLKQKEIFEGILCTLKD